jgi:cytochrome c oxidase subunit 2
MAGGLALLFPGHAAAASFWQASPRSPEAASIAFLFWLVMAVAAVFLFGVLGALVYMVIRFRARPGQPDPPPNYGSLRLEVWWTLIPFGLLVVVFGFMVREMNTEIAPRPNALEVTVVGRQWWWEYRYPDGVVAANELHIPAGRQIRLNLQSGDVIHNFWVPELAGKEQTIPGTTNVWTLSAERPGTYEGACSEYCGGQHGWMRLSVVAQEPPEFDRWLAAQREPAASGVLSAHASALALYAANACGGCHTLAGVSQGKAGPDLTHVGGRSTLGAGVLRNTPENMARWMKDPQAVKPGALMPNFRLSEEQARQMAALLTDLK